MNAIILALALVWSAICVGAGYHFRDERAVNEKLVLARQGQDAYNHLEQRYNAVASELQAHLLADQNETQTITKYVDRIVDRPVYRNDCFDDDGLRLANDAILGRASLAPKPDGAVPAPHQP